MGVTRSEVRNDNHTCIALTNNTYKDYNNNMTYMYMHITRRNWKYELILLSYISGLD